MRTTSDLDKQNIPEPSPMLTETRVLQSNKIRVRHMKSWVLRRQMPKTSSWVLMEQLPRAPYCNTCALTWSRGLYRLFWTYHIIPLLMLMHSKHLLVSAMCCQTMNSPSIWRGTGVYCDISSNLWSRQLPTLPPLYFNWRRFRKAPSWYLWCQCWWKESNIECGMNFELWWEV